jgi:hypothetical protein
MQFHLAVVDTAAKVTMRLDRLQVATVDRAAVVAVAELKQAAQETKEVILQLKVMRAALRCLVIQHRQAQAVVVVEHLP